jgi:hypothetical protein
LDYLSLNYQNQIPGEEFKELPRLRTLNLDHCLELGPLVTYMTCLISLELEGIGPIDCSPLRGLKYPLRDLKLGQVLQPYGLKNLFAMPKTGETSSTCLSKFYSGLSQLETLILTKKFDEGIEDLSDWISTLPSSLTYLHQAPILSSSSKTTVHVLDAWFVTLIPPSALHLLPRGMKSLEIHCVGLERSHLIHLPKSLTNLKVMGDSSSSIHPSDLHLLPNNLHYLEFPPSVDIPIQPFSYTRQPPKEIQEFSNHRRLLFNNSGIPPYERHNVTTGICFSPKPDRHPTIDDLFQR